MREMREMRDEREIKKFREITQSEIPKLRDFLLEKQSGLCKLCQRQITSETGYSLDHQHCTKSEELGENGAGLVRGVLCRDCNVLEGKFWNASKRYRIPNLQENPVQARIDWLRNLANYLESNASNNTEILEIPTLHPSERRPVKMTKSLYNMLKEEFESSAENYKKNGELKSFPKFNGRWNKKLTEIYNGLNF